MADGLIALVFALPASRMTSPQAVGFSDPLVGKAKITIGWPGKSKQSIAVDLKFLSPPSVGDRKQGQDIAKRYWRAGFGVLLNAFDLIKLCVSVQQRPKGDLGQLR